MSIMSTNVLTDQNSWEVKRKLRIAILDLYDGAENQGMRCIRTIIDDWARANDYLFSVSEFNVRQKCEVPDTTFDIYISTGGPGSPLESEGTEWEIKMFDWVNQIETWNNGSENFPKKHVFFICHSFQLICRYYQLGLVSKRKSTSFGVFPVHMIEDGYDEPVFENLKNPFYAVDSREYQVTEPNFDAIAARGGKILALEKLRPHVDLERAIMAIRINEYFIATQFHPEADASGMSMYLQRQDKKETVIANHGEPKWKSMIEHLEDPNKISFTNKHILPNFLNLAAGNLVEA